MSMNSNLPGFALVLTVLPFVALMVSIGSLWFARKSWMQSNRPIVTVFVSEKDPEEGTVFDLIVANTGNRPAICVRLIATQDEIARLCEEGINAARFESVAENFSVAGEIPLLRNGEQLETAFGAVLRNDPEGPWLRYGSQTEISVSYRDLEGRKYISRMPLRIYARQGFGGAIWAS